MCKLGATLVLLQATSKRMMGLNIITYNRFLTSFTILVFDYELILQLILGIAFFFVFFKMKLKLFAYIALLEQT